MTDGTTEFGFQWGPVEVARCCSLPGDRRVLQIKTEHRTLDVYVSATGRSVRVFNGHGLPRAEWKPEGAR